MIHMTWHFLICLSSDYRFVVQSVIVPKCKSIKVQSSYSTFPWRWIIFYNRENKTATDDKKSHYWFTMSLRSDGFDSCCELGMLSRYGGISGIQSDDWALEFFYDRKYSRCLSFLWNWVYVWQRLWDTFQPSYSNVITYKKKYSFQYNQCFSVLTHLMLPSRVVTHGFF
jgi:hypothetical protein